MTRQTMRDPLVIERHYAASPEKIFSAWTDVELLTQWFGCDTDMLWDVHEWDPSPGGAIRVSLDFDTGPFEVTGKFVTVEPPTRLVYEWDVDQLVTVTIAPNADGTGSTMRLEHAGLPNAEMTEIVTAGWSSGVVQILEVLT